MRDRLKPPIPQPVNTFALPVLISAALLCSAPQSVHAQDQPPTPTPAEAAPQDTEAKGTLVVTVKHSETANPLEKVPVAGAIVRIDGPNLARTIDTRTDAFGVATFNGVPEGTYSVYFPQGEFEIDPKPKDPDAPVAEVTIRNKETTNVTLVARKRKIVLTTTEQLLFLKPSDVSNHVTRDRDFISRFPHTAGNNQDLTSVLRSVPGLVPDAINQIHPRGEHSLNAATYIDGFLLPQQFVGRANSFLLPGVIQSVITRVAGLAPEYGGGSGAMYDIKTIRPTNRKPEIAAALRLGEFNTRGITLNFSGRRGLRLKSKGEGQPRIGNLSYLFAIDNRYTANALESPQPGSQSKFNDGASELFFGKVTANIGFGRELGVMFNLSSGRTNIAQRDGLDDSFARFGAGFGFTGLKTEGSGIQSQSELGQKLRQKDNNSLTAITFGTTMPSGMRVNAAFGVAKTTQAYVNVGTANLNFNNLPRDSSIEYIPAVKTDTDTIFFQADATPPPLMKGIHRVKAGVVAHLFDGTDGYQYFPQSQIALDQLAVLEPRLVPVGFLDENRRFNITGAPVAPALTAERSGYYAAFYVQDTFKPRKGMTLNFGVRLDSYQQNIKTKTNVRGDSLDLPGINKTEISPRVNVAFLLPGEKISFFKQPTLLRVGYNKLFTPPVGGQGNYIGFAPGTRFPLASGGFLPGATAVNPVQPQTSEIYDLSIERQLGSDKVIKLTIYSKDLKNTLTAQQLITGMQAGMLSLFNVGNGGASGMELSFEMRPRRDKDNKELSAPYGYLNLATSSASPSNSNTFTNIGQRYGLPFYEYDQETTIDLGVAYKFKNGATAGLGIYSGSGLFSSAMRFPLSPIANSGRDSVTQIDLRYNSGPRFLQGKLALELGIENMGDSKARYSFRNGLGGTRFVQGRRLMLMATGKF